MGNNSSAISGPTKVIFRKYLNGGDVVALFPEVPHDGSGHYCVSYQKVGQHGAADCQHVIRETRAAEQWEFKDLQTELERIGYNLDIRQRTPCDAYSTRSVRARLVLTGTAA